MTEQQIGNWRIPSEEEWMLLDRFIADQIDPNERAAVTTLLSRDPSLRDLLWLMRRDELSAQESESELKRGWTDFNIRLAANQSSTDLRLVSTERLTARTLRPTPPHGLLHRWRRPAVRAGAILGMLSVPVVGGVIWNAQRSTTAPAIAMHEMATQAGQHSAIRLADGTVITLGPQSRLLVSSQFGREDRTIVLDGEAMFEVVHDEQLPLSVKTKHAVTRVLGTKFNVRTFGDTTTVAVVSGKISMESPTHAIPGVTVTAGYVGRLAATGDASVVHGDVNAHVAWVDQRFVFRDTPMENVLADLSRWYGVRFTVDDPAFLQRRLTADWENRSLESVLKSLSIAFHIKVERNGSEVKLYTRESDSHSRRNQE